MLGNAVTALLKFSLPEVLERNDRFMKHLRATLTPLALALLVVSCSSSKSNQNGVAGPTGGASSLTGTGGSSAGSTSASDAAAGDAGTEQDAGSTFDGSCTTLPGKIVYIESGDTQENLLKNLGRHLRDTANITIVFNLTGSCTLINDMYTGAKVVPNGTLKYIPSTAENAAWTPSMAELTCTTPADGVSIDVAISALFVQSCGLGGPPAGSNFGSHPGPDPGLYVHRSDRERSNGNLGRGSLLRFRFRRSQSVGTDIQPLEQRIVHVYSTADQEHIGRNGTQY